VYGISAVGDRGVTSTAVLVPLGIGLVLLAAFVRRQRSAPVPLLPAEELRRPQLRAGAVLLLGTAAAFSASTSAGPQYFQLVQGLSPLQTSLLFLTTDTGLLAASSFVPWLVGRLGAVRRGGVRCRRHRRSAGHPGDVGLPRAAADVDPSAVETAEERVAAAVAAAEELGDDGAGLLQGAAKAFATAYQSGLLAAATTSAAALVVVLVDRRAGAGGRRRAVARSAASTRS